VKQESLLFYGIKITGEEARNGIKKINFKVVFKENKKN
jgi:hypothetical protein